MVSTTWRCQFWHHRGCGRGSWVNSNCEICHPCFCCCFVGFPSPWSLKV